MAKGQLRGNKEAKKPKSDKAEEFGVGLQEVTRGDGPGAKPAGEEILK